MRKLHLSTMTMVMALWACGDDSDTTGSASGGSSSSAGQGGAAASSSSSSSSGQGGAGVGGNTAGGEGVFADSTVEGLAATMSCPSPDAAEFEAPFLVNGIAGNNWSFGCYTSSINGLSGATVLITVEDYQDLPQGAVTETSAGGFSIIAKNSDATMGQLRTEADNATAFTLSASFDPATQRLTGTFSATFGPAQNPGEAEGSINGTFDMIRFMQ